MQPSGNGAPISSSSSTLRGGKRFENLHRKSFPKFGTPAWGTHSQVGEGSWMYVSNSKSWAEGAQVDLNECIYICCSSVEWLLQTENGPEPSSPGCLFANDFCNQTIVHYVAQKRPASPCKPLKDVWLQYKHHRASATLPGVGWAVLHCADSALQAAIYTCWSCVLFGCYTGSHL